MLRKACTVAIANAICTSAARCALASTPYCRRYCAHTLRCLSLDQLKPTEAFCIVSVRMLALLARLARCSAPILSRPLPTSISTNRWRYVSTWTLPTGLLTRLWLISPVAAHRTSRLASPLPKLAFRAPVAGGATRVRLVLAGRAREAVQGTAIVLVATSGAVLALFLCRLPL
jgi:hypothetical protein